ncbi:MAG: 2-oxoacid:acceptor oxidoreductase family protein [Deltaproteobacteria bacterium]|nr:2-oxoacid:acceptor oxidoreductase family protein [Deltaproteobacteria bacterium]
MISKTIFSGFGGQGVLMMGYSLAHSAMTAGYHTTYLPSYGAEMRGGTANCTIAVADEEIASPISSEPDYLVVMNMPSLYTFQNKLTPGGALFINSSIVDARPSRQDIEVFAVPCGKIAESLGDIRASNIVMMGAFIRKTSLVTLDTYLRSLETIMGSKKKKAMEINTKALAAGYELLKIS